MAYLALDSTIAQNSMEGLDLKTIRVMFGFVEKTGLGGQVVLRVNNPISALLIRIPSIVEGECTVKLVMATIHSQKK